MFQERRNEIREKDFFGRWWLQPQKHSVPDLSIRISKNSQKFGKGFSQFRMRQTHFAHLL